jgi:hypothetical protein
LWETLNEVGYVAPPLYEVVSFWDQGVPYARTNAIMFPHPEHPEWADLSLMFFARHGVESVESAAMQILHTFCEQHPDEVMLTALGLFGPTRPGLARAYIAHRRVAHGGPSSGCCVPASRFLEAVYNMQVFHLSSQGMLSVVLMDSTAMRDILTLDLQYERQTIAHLQQEIVTLHDERIQWHQERAELTEQLFTRDHTLEMTQV